MNKGSLKLREQEARKFPNSKLTKLVSCGVGNAWGSDDLIATCMLSLSLQCLFIHAISYKQEAT